MKASSKTVLYLVLTILWMTGIFLFSARPADLSSQDSSRLSGWIASIRYSDFDEWTPEEQLAFTESIDYPVRKAAHATEYGILCILLTLTLSGFAAAGKQLPLPVFGMAWIIAVLYAASDEFHQLFVFGRSGRLTDVLIDACGAALGLLLFYLGRLFLSPAAQRASRKR